MSNPASSSLSKDAVLITHDRGVTTFTLNRPESFNSLSSEMLGALQQAVDELDEQTRILVLRGAGKVFCAGHDLKEMRQHDQRAWFDALFEQCSALMQSLQSLPVPVIAAVHGIATAAGCQLVATADLAIATDDCRFAVSGIKVGLFCSTPAVALSRNMGRKRAMEMLLTGDFIDAATAEQWGLLNDVVPRDQLDAALDAMCQRILVNSQVAVATGKQQFHRQVELPTAEAYRHAAGCMSENMLAADVAEGIDAFKEKRSPRWRHC